MPDRVPIQVPHLRLFRVEDSEQAKRILVDLEGEPNWRPVLLGDLVVILALFRTPFQRSYQRLLGLLATYCEYASESAVVSGFRLHQDLGSNDRRTSFICTR